MLRNEREPVIKNGSPIDREVRAEAKRLYVEGEVKTRAEAADRVGVSREAVYKWGREEDWDLARAVREKKIAERRDAERVDDLTAYDRKHLDFSGKVLRVAEAALGLVAEDIQEAQKENKEAAAAGKKKRPRPIRTRELADLANVAAKVQEVQRKAIGADEEKRDERYVLELEDFEETIRKRIESGDLPGGEKKEPEADA